MRSASGAAAAVALLIGSAAAEMCATDTAYDVKSGAVPLPETIKNVTDAQVCANKCKAAPECACFNFVQAENLCRGFSVCGQPAPAEGSLSGRGGCVVRPSEQACQAGLDDTIAQSGMKVVRGRDWRWKNQDGGAGNVGTLLRRTETCKGGGWWKIEWDGKPTRKSYRVGCDGHFDVARAGCSGADTQAKRCAFNDLFWPQGAAPAGPGCERDSYVPDGHSCTFIRVDHNCETATCDSFQWTTARPRCLPRSGLTPARPAADSGGCPFDVLKVPSDVTASGLSANCHEGGTVPRGGHCMFMRPGHSCRTVSCDDAGFWSAEGPVCVPRKESTAQCGAQGLALPADAHPRDECSKTMAGMFCTVEKAGHSCDVAVCGTDGRWLNSTPACTKLGCRFDQLVVPKGAYSVGENCQAGGTVTIGHLCSFQRAGAKCEMALCTASGWSSTEPSCQADEKTLASDAPICDSDTQYMGRRVGNLVLDVVSYPTTAAECSLACMKRSGCTCFTFSGHNMQCTFLEQCQTPTPRAHVFHFTSGPAGCQPATPASAKVARDCRLPVDKAVVGARVVRGADWKWGDQDGSGEGVILGKGESCGSGSWFTVQWGVTKVTNDYRVGCDGMTDLCAADSPVVQPVMSPGGRSAPIGRVGGRGGGGRGGGRGSGRGSAGGRGSGPTSKDTFRCEADRSATGNDIYTVPGVESMQMCQHYCRNMPECQALVLRPDRSCTLKREAPFGEASKGDQLCKRVEDERVALPIQMVQQDAQAHGFVCRDAERFIGSELFQLPGVDRAACWTHCLQAPDCRGVTHSASSCSLHLDISKLGEAPAGTAACERTVQAEKKTSGKYNYKCQKDHTFNGGDLLHLVSIESRQACEEYCTKVAECVALVWREGTCTLKAYLTAPTEVGGDQGFVACAKTTDDVAPFDDSTSSNGQPFSCQKGARFTGDKLFQFKGLKSERECASLCDRLDDCAAVNYLAGDESTCVMIGNVGMVSRAAEDAMACSKPGVKAEVMDNTDPQAGTATARRAFTLAVSEAPRRAQQLTGHAHEAPDPATIQALLDEVAVCNFDSFGQRICGPATGSSPLTPGEPYWTRNHQGVYVRLPEVSTVRPLGFGWTCGTNSRFIEENGPANIATIVDIAHPEDCQRLCDENTDCFAWSHLAKCPAPILQPVVKPPTGRCRVCKLYNCDLAPSGNPPPTVPDFINPRFSSYCFNTTKLPTCKTTLVGLPCDNDWPGKEVAGTVGAGSCAAEPSCIETQDDLEAFECRNHCSNLPGCLNWVFYKTKNADGTGPTHCIFYTEVGASQLVDSPRGNDVFFCGEPATPAPTGMAFHMSTFLPMALDVFRPHIPQFIANVTNWLNTNCIPQSLSPIVADDLVVCVYDLYSKEMEFYGRDEFRAKHPGEYWDFPVPTEFVPGRWHAGPGPSTAGAESHALKRRFQTLAAKGTMVQVQMSAPDSVKTAERQQAVAAATAAAARALAPRKYTCQATYGYEGGDITKLADLDSADECLRQCTNTPGCTKLNFDVDHTCFLKGEDATVSVASGASSVVGCEWDRAPAHTRPADRTAYSCEGDTAYVGGDIFVMQHLTDLEMCKKMCSQISQDCDLVVFYGDGTCALKRLSEAAEVDTPELAGTACRAQTAAAPLADQYTCTPGAYVGGELFQVEDVPSVTECERYCSSVAQCAVALYDDRQRCSLRSNDAAFQPDPAGWAAGARACMKQGSGPEQGERPEYHCDAGWAHSGADLSVLQDVARADDCLAACTRLAQCRVAVYKDRACRLKGADAQAVADAGAVSCLRRGAALEEAPGAAGDFQCVTDRMFEGGDLMQMENVGSMRECQAQCAAIADCAVVVHRSGVCLLKNTDAKAVRAEALRGGATACAKKAQAAALRLAAREGGAVYDCREGVTYDGGRLVSADNVADPSKCEGLCDMVPECAVAIWERGACTLASASATRVTVPDAVTSCAKVTAGTAPHAGAEAFDCAAETSYPGNDILVVSNVETAADCRAHCADVPDCAVAIHSHSTCALRGAEAAAAAPHSAAGATACVRAAKRVALPRDQSGRRCEIGATLAGGHLYDVSGVKSSDECMRHCRKVSTECRGFTFSSDGLCSLRGTGATLRRVSGQEVVSCLNTPKTPAATEGVAFQCRSAHSAEGATLRRAEASSSDECLGLCTSDRQCGGFAYARQQCTLKGDGARLVPALGGGGMACLRKEAVAPGKATEPFRCTADAGYLGGDLQVFGGVRTVDDCKAHCAKDPACAAVVHTEQGVCYLKGADATPVTRRVLVNVLSRSGDVDAPVIGTACVRSSAARERRAADLADKGGFTCDIGRQFIGGELFSVSGVSAEDCQAQCARVPQCAAIVYSPDRSCSLRNSAAAPVRDSSGQALSCMRAAGSDDGAAAAGFRCDAHGSFSGGELLTLEGVATPGDCAAHCAVVVGCEVAVHSGQRCSLRNGDATAAGSDAGSSVCTRAEHRQQAAPAPAQTGAAAARWQCAEHSFGGDGHGDLFLLEGVGSLRLCQQQCAGLASCGGVEYRRKQLACVLKVTGSTPTGGSDPAAAPVSCVRVDAPAPQGLLPCTCAANWASEEDGEACSAAQHGCPSKACDGSPRRWCRVAQSGCATEEYGGWSYCDESTPSEREGSLNKQGARFRGLSGGAYSDGSDVAPEFTDWGYELTGEAGFNQQVGFQLSAGSDGLVIQNIEPHSPASNAKMMSGEVLLKVGGTAVATEAEAWSLIAAALSAGPTVALLVRKPVPPMGKVWYHDFSHAINVDYIDLAVWRGMAMPDFNGPKSPAGGGFWVRTRVRAHINTFTAPFRYNWYLLASTINEALLGQHNYFKDYMNPVLEGMQMGGIEQGTIVPPAVLEPKLYSRVPIAKITGQMLYSRPWQRYSFLPGASPQVSSAQDTYLGETAISVLVGLLEGARPPPYFQIWEIQECTTSGTDEDPSDDVCCLFYACPNGWGGVTQGCLDRNGDSIEMRERHARELGLPHPYSPGGWLEGMDQPAAAPTNFGGPYGHLFDKTAWEGGQGRQQCSLGPQLAAGAYYSKVKYGYIIDQPEDASYDDRMAFLNGVLKTCQDSCVHFLGFENALHGGEITVSGNATKQSHQEAALSRRGGLLDGAGDQIIGSQFAREAFARLDADSNGVLSQFELGVSGLGSTLGWQSGTRAHYPWDQPESFFMQGRYKVAYGSYELIQADADNGRIDEAYYVLRQHALNLLMQGATDASLTLVIEGLREDGLTFNFTFNDSTTPVPELAPADTDDGVNTTSPTAAPTGSPQSAGAMRHLLEVGAAQVELMHGDKVVADLSKRVAAAAVNSADGRAKERFLRATEHIAATHASGRHASALQFSTAMHYTVDGSMPLQITLANATTYLGALVGQQAGGRTVISASVAEHPDDTSHGIKDLQVTMTIAGAGGSPQIGAIDAEVFATDIAAAFTTVDLSKNRVQSDDRTPASADFSALADNNVRAVFRIQNRIQRVIPCQLGDLGSHYGLLSNTHNLDDQQPFTGTLEECRALCNTKSGCYAFSRQNIGTAEDTQPKACWLKNKLIPYLGDQYSHQGYTTYAVRCPDDTNRCTWTMLEGVALHVLEESDSYPSRYVDSADHCRDSCEMVPDCIGTSYRPIKLHSTTSPGYCFFITQRDATRVDHEEFTGYVCRRMSETPSPWRFATPRPAEYGTCEDTGNAACAAPGSMCLQAHGAWRCVCGAGYHCKGCTPGAMQQNPYCDCSVPSLPKLCVAEPNPTPTLPPCADGLAQTAQCGDPQAGHTCYLTSTPEGEGHACGCAPDYHCYGPSCSGAPTQPKRCIPDSCLPELVGPAIADEIRLMDECPEWYHQGLGGAGDGDGDAAGDGAGYADSGNPCIFAWPLGMTKAGIKTIYSEFLIPHEYPCRLTSTCDRLRQIISSMVDLATMKWVDHTPPLKRQVDAIVNAYSQCSGGMANYKLTPAPTTFQSLEKAWIMAVTRTLDDFSRASNQEHPDIEVGTVPEWYIQANFSDTRPLRFPEPFGVSVTYIPTHSQTTHTVAFRLQNVTVDTIWGQNGDAADGISSPGPLEQLREQLAESEGIPLEHIVLGRICLTRALTGEEYGCFDPQGNPYPSTSDPHPWNVTHWYPFAYSPDAVHVTVCERESDTGDYVDPVSGTHRMNTGQTADLSWNISCSTGEEIEITGAFYGREHCHNQLCFAYPEFSPDGATNCGASSCPDGEDCRCSAADQQALEGRVRAHCQNKERCDIVVADIVDGLVTNCPSENKYLWVEFKCVPTSSARRAATLSDLSKMCGDGGCDVHVDMRLQMDTEETVRVVRRPGGGVSQLRAGDPIMSHVTVAERIGAATDALDRIADNNVLQSVQERYGFKFSSQALKSHLDQGLAQWVRSSFGANAAANFPGSCHVAVVSRDLDCVSGRCVGTDLPAAVRQTDCQGRWQCSEHWCNQHGTAEGFDGGCSCKCRPGFVGERCEICDTGYSGYPDCAAPAAEAKQQPAQPTPSTPAAKPKAAGRQAVPLSAFPPSHMLRRMHLTQVMDVAKRVGLDIDGYDSRAEYVDAIESMRASLGGRTPAPTQKPAHTELFHVAISVPLTDLPQRHTAMRAALEHALRSTRPQAVRITAACPVSACVPECPASPTASQWREGSGSCVPLGILIAKGAAAVATADEEGLMAPLPEGGVIELEIDFDADAPDLALKPKLAAAVLAAALRKPDSPLHGLGVLGTVHSAAEGQAVGESQPADATDSVAWIPVVVCVGVLLLCAVWAVLVGLYARSRGESAEKEWLNAPEPAHSDECLVLKRPGEQLGISWDDHTVVADVAKGSPADRVGVQRFLRRRVTHVNGTPVRRLSEIRDASIGASTVWLRFSRGAADAGSAETDPDLWLMSEWCSEPIAACAGAYRLLPSLVINDHPVYERTDGNRWFYSTARGHWAVTDSQLEFARGGGAMISAGPHHGAPPHAVLQWRTKSGEPCDALVAKEQQTAHGFRVGQRVVCAQDITERQAVVVRIGQQGVVKGVSATMPDAAVTVRFQGLSRDVNVMPDEVDAASGPRVMVRSSEGKVLECEVVNANETQIKVHYLSLGKEHDEWISKESQRIAPMRPQDSPAAGDTVRLRPGAASVPRGSLQPGEEGVLVRDAGPQSVAPFKVRGPRGDTSWYQPDHLERVATR